MLLLSAELAELYALNEEYESGAEGGSEQVGKLTLSLPPSSHR